MISAEEIQKKAERKFPDFLRWKASQILFSEVLNEEKQTFNSEQTSEFLDSESFVTNFFPLEIKADKGNASGNLTEYEKEIAPLIAKSKQKVGKGYELLFEEVNTRKNGKQTSIRAIIFSCEEDFLFTAKKKNEAENFEDGLFVLKNELNGFKNKDLLYRLYDWSVHHFADLTLPHKNESNFWQNICLCVNFLCENPNTQKYIRELPVKVHTKFIENNKSLIHSLTLLKKKMLCEVAEGYQVQHNGENKNIIARSVVSTTSTGSRQAGQTTTKPSSFEKIYGLKEKPILVRFRSLSSKNSLKLGSLSLSELSLTLEDFSQLPKSDELSSINKIFIVENEMVFLTFPKVPNALCIWGHGFSAVELKNATWLSNFPLYYFGDLDEHGFLILSDFRKYFPNTKSFCMDLQTLKEFNEFCVEGKTLQGSFIPENLTENEKQVFLELKKDKTKNRLEQERISNEWILQNLIFNLR